VRLRPYVLHVPGVCGHRGAGDAELFETVERTLPDRLRRSYRRSLAESAILPRSSDSPVTSSRACRSRTPDLMGSSLVLGGRTPLTRGSHWGSDGARSDVIEAGFNPPQHR
jgi:hypothetical protein